MRSVKAENKDKWSQVKKAFTENKEGNMRAVNALIQDGKDREEELLLIAKELGTFKESTSSAILLMMKQIPKKKDESTLADTLTTATNALINEYVILQHKYDEECEENDRLRNQVDPRNLRTSTSTSTMLQRDLGLFNCYITFLFFCYIFIFLFKFFFLFIKILFDAIEKI